MTIPGGGGQAGPRSFAQPAWSGTEGRELLDRFDAALRDLTSRWPAIRDILGSVLLGPSAKRLRPSMVLAAGSFGRPNRDALIATAMASELMHTASLVHDDIIDESAVRRGRPALHRVHGPRAAVFVGAHLCHVANDLVLGITGVSAATHRELNDIMAQAAAHVCLGQLEESLNIGNLAISENAHLRIIELKTARLFEASCKMGAVVGGSWVDALQEYGRQFGLLYQVADDLRDIVGSRKDTGRSPGTDIKEGIYTLSLIRALREDDSHSRRLKEVLGHRGRSLSPLEMDKVFAELRAGDGIEYAAQRAREYAAAAKKSIHGLPRTGARRALTEAVDAVLDGLDIPP